MTKVWACLQVHFFPAQKSIMSPFKINIFICTFQRYS